MIAWESALSERGTSRRLPRAEGWNRLSAAATLARARASTSAGLVDGSGAVLGPKLPAVAVALTCAGATACAGLVDWPGAVLGSSLFAVALPLLLSGALTPVRILVAVLAVSRGIQREDRARAE